MNLKIIMNTVNWCNFGLADNFGHHIFVTLMDLIHFIFLEEGLLLSFTDRPITGSSIPYICQPSRILWDSPHFDNAKTIEEK